MKKIAIIGTQGLPAQYGGFETLAENLVEKHAQDITYTVFCSKRNYLVHPRQYKGALLKYIPLFHANGIQSIPYDILSLCLSLRQYDTILILGTSGCIFLPFFRLLYRKKLIVNIDGLEHKREKWGSLARWFLRHSEAAALRHADTIIVDNEGIQEYVTHTYHKPSILIAYGADHVARNISSHEQAALLDSYFLRPKEYALSVCRIEPENNCHLILKAFADSGKKLVFVGNWHENNYGQELHHTYNSGPNIRLLDAMYDLDRLYTLRANCKVYIHGHSAGGTNPSLVEAMSLGLPILAFKCIYNQKTTEYKAAYYTDEGSLKEMISSGEQRFPQNGAAMQEIAKRRYKWELIVKQYEALY